MARIRGKFAPLMAELGNDERWLLELNDNEKLIYILVLFTVYTTNGTAPLDPRYYKVRYALVQRKHTISTALDKIRGLFPKLIVQDKKISLLNSMHYENRVATKLSLEVEEEVEEEVDTSACAESLKSETPKKEKEKPSERLKASIDHVFKSGLNIYSLLNRLRKEKKIGHVPDDVLIAVCNEFELKKDKITNKWPWFCITIEQKWRQYNAGPNEKKGQQEKNEFVGLEKMLKNLAPKNGVLLQEGA